VEEEMSEDDPTKEAIRLTLQLPTILLTASTESRDLGDSSSFITLNQRREDPARPCDPLATVAYESWMFHKSSDAALNHWQNLPSDVIRFAVVEDAILHAGSLCEIFLCSGQEDTISLKRLFADIDTNIQKYKRLREEQKALRRECCQKRAVLQLRGAIQHSNLPPNDLTWALRTVSRAAVTLATTAAGNG
jgi:hypothetical protein